MKYSLELVARCEESEELEQLKNLFAPEDKELSNGRAKYVIEESDLKLVFKVEAEDAVALRATITSITKTLDIYEQTKRII